MMSRRKPPSSRHAQYSVSPNNHYSSSSNVQSQYSPPSSTSQLSPLNGSDLSEVEIRYVNMVECLRDEVGFLEESSSNLLVELRESQDANYVLTEELRRSQRSNMNTLDELQACQTANAVLREELQRLEQGSVKINRETEKYRKANKLLREEIKDLKSHHLRRKNSILLVKEKAKDIQDGLLNNNLSEVSTLQQAVGIIVETVEDEALNYTGYLPTDSDTQSTDGGGEESLSNFTPKVVKRDRIISRRSPIFRKMFPSPQLRPNDHRSEQNGLFTRHQLYADFDDRRERSQSLNTKDVETFSPPHPVRRRGSLDDINRQNVVPSNLQNGNSHIRQTLSIDEINENIKYNRKNLILDLNGNLEQRTGKKTFDMLV